MFVSAGCSTRHTLDGWVHLPSTGEVAGQLLGRGPRAREHDVGVGVPAQRHDRDPGVDAVQAPHVRAEPTLPGVTERAVAAAGVDAVAELLATLERVDGALGEEVAAEAEGGRAPLAVVGARLRRAAGQREEYDAQRRSGLTANHPFNGSGHLPGRVSFICSH